MILKTMYNSENTYLGPIRWITDRKNLLQRRYRIIESHLEEIMIKTSPDILKQTYFDVRNIQMLRSSNKISSSLNIQLKIYPDEAKYFLRLKKQYGVYYNKNYYSNIKFRSKEINTRGMYDFFIPRPMNLLFPKIHLLFFQRFLLTVEK